MARDRNHGQELVETFSGMVVESLAIKQDFATATVGCRDCPDSMRLSSGDRVTVALSCYEDHSWEIQCLGCSKHPIESVENAMNIRAERQAVVSATLESTGYLPPDGNFEPDALTLGNVEILDYSPTADGYGG